MIPLGSSPDGSPTIGSRLVEIRSALGLSVDDVAQRTGVPVSTLKKWEGGHRAPGAEQLSKLSVLGINLDWLLTGRGSTLLEKGGAEPPSAADSEFVTIPLYDVEVGAGDGQVVEVEDVKERLAFRKDWISREIGIPPSQLALVKVAGDSMEPTLSDGDTLLMDRSIDRLINDGIYVLRLDGVLLAKRLQRQGQPGQLQVTSDNPLYDSFWVDLERMPDIAIIGRVVWAGHRF